MMKSKFGTFLWAVALIISAGMLILITVKTSARTPLTAEDITDGRINQAVAYEEFGDYLPYDKIDDILPIHVRPPKYIYVEMPHGGCMAIRNPISAVDKEGNVLYEMKVIQPKVVYINIDGRCIAYRAIENNAAN